eukprot:3831488-Prymnesium_polylepis.1
MDTDKDRTDAHCTAHAQTKKVAVVRMDAGEEECRAAGSGSERCVSVHDTPAAWARRRFLNFVKEICHAGQQR